MILLKTVEPGQATGSVAQVYAAFDRAGAVPQPMQLLSASPRLQELQFQSMGYFMNHPTLTAPLLAAIRLAASTLACHDFCLDFNSGLLRRMGMSDADLEAVAQGRAPESLEEREGALLAFAHKALSAPQDVRAADLEALRNLGWTDADILDAVSHGAGLMTSTLLQKAFVR